MTLSSAYIELFIREKSPGGNVLGECPDTGGNGGGGGDAAVTC